MTPTAYTEGYDAYQAGTPITANPHDLATDEFDHLEWNDGWNAALDMECDE